MNDDGYFLLINYETFNPILKHKQEKKIVTRLKINQKISAMFEISIKYYIYTYNVDKHEAIHTLSNDLGNSTSPFSQKKKEKENTNQMCKIWLLWHKTVQYRVLAVSML